jgi:hypothetical protein
MTIEELSDKLNLWRKNKKSKRERIPEAYWDEAVKLTKEFSSSVVAAKLSLSAGDLKKRMGTPSLSKEKIIFKELPPVPQKKSSLLVEFTTPSGMNIRIYS